MNSPAADIAQAGQARPVQFDEKTIARFWSKVEQRGPDECWLWKNKPAKNGYGIFGVKHQFTMLAHRASYVIAFGAIPEGLLVCHKRHCTSRLCVNPNHLYAGTHKDNTADGLAVGTMWPNGFTGENNRRHILTREQVLDIMSLWRSRKFTLKTLGKRFCVSAKTIGSIVAGYNWTEVTGVVAGSTTRSIAEDAEQRKLTDNDVRYIRNHYTGERHQRRALAEQFKVSFQTIHRVTLGGTHKRLAQLKPEA